MVTVMALPARVPVIWRPLLVLPVIFPTVASSSVIESDICCASQPVIPAGFRFGKLTVPLYVPDATATKLAVTVAFLVTRNEHVPELVHVSPDQLVNNFPEDARCVIVSIVPPG